jgi:cytochrome c oxidase assembly factor CtaG
LAVLFVIFRMAGLTDATPREQRPRWLLVFGVAMFVAGMILLVVAARSGG